LSELGSEAVVGSVLLAFLVNNFLIDRLDRRRFGALSAHAGMRLGAKHAEKLRGALNGLMVMSPEFRHDTARLFLSMFGRSRDIRRELAKDPFDLLERDPRCAMAVTRLVRTLAQ
jgi:hypothetical protein